MQVKIDVISDVVCPWCYIGKRNLTRALQLVSDIDCSVTWQPYQLDPMIPESGVDRKAYMEKKFPDKGKLFAMQNNLLDAAREAELVLNLDSIEMTPNTLNAHRLIHWARGQGIDDIMVERLMSAYFVDGENIGNTETLARLAGEAGLESDIIGRLLAGEADKVTVQTEIEKYRGMGVTGVPCFIFIDQLAIMGAQPPEALANAITRVAADLS